MVTLQENVVKFINDLIISHTGDQLSSDSGLVLIDELMDAFQFTHSLKMLLDLTKIDIIGHIKTIKFSNNWCFRLLRVMLRFFREYLTVRSCIPNTLTG